MPDRIGPAPRDGLCITDMRNTAPFAGGVKMNDKWSLRLHPAFIGCGGKSLGDPDRLQNPCLQTDAEFLVQLARSRKLRRFARFDLTSGKFP